MKQLDDDVSPPASFLNHHNYTKWYVDLVSLIYLLKPESSLWPWPMWPLNLTHINVTFDVDPCDLWPWLTMLLRCKKHLNIIFPYLVTSIFDLDLRGWPKRHSGIPQTKFRGPRSYTFRVIIYLVIFGTQTESDALEHTGHKHRCAKKSLSCARTPLPFNGLMFQ